MDMSVLILRVRRLLQRSAILQVGVLLAFWSAGDVVVRFTGLPLPGGVIGMLLMLALLSTQAVQPASVGRGAQWLLGNMLLFFVPAVLAVLNHRELLGLLGVKILLIILVGTVLVMGVTALTVEVCIRRGALRAVQRLPG